ncbi:hypothetical protein Bca52824_063831 [Brassica carinata]|uniref:Arabidopsis retrotransposon Orf1 C-terminal domain-containing protein n=1 Tax=Brassica carinata TaxID=52824 RepID=A0A8X7QF52_BRACI|nr:hypothetical protein Bca52824_063831 [Brassica carinata]
MIGTGFIDLLEQRSHLSGAQDRDMPHASLAHCYHGTTTAASVTQWELCLLYQGVRHLLPAFGNSTFPPATAFNMGAVLAANLAGYKGKVTKYKSNACGFGAVITRILRHVGVDCKNQQVGLNRSNNIAWNYLDVIYLVSKEFIAGPHSRIHRDGPYVYAACWVYAELGLYHQTESEWPCPSVLQ